MSDLVGNPEDRFSRVEAQITLLMHQAHTKNHLDLTPPYFSSDINSGGFKYGVNKVAFRTSSGGTSTTNGGGGGNASAFTG